MRALALLLSLILLPGAYARAQTWPDRSVLMLASAAPGGGVDLIARLVAQSLSEQLHQTFVVENKGGAGGTIAAAQISRSAPDGYTLLLCSNGEMTLAPFVQKQIAYDPLSDLAPVLLIASAPQVIVVNPKVPAQTMRELISYAKGKGGVGYGTPGFGSSAHVGFELVKTENSLPFFHIAYKGGGPAIADLLAGQIEMAVVTMPAIAPMISAKSVRPLAVLGPVRSSLLPDVPTLEEATGIQSRDASSWFALMAPAKTPSDILDKLQKASVTALTPEVRERLAKAMLDVVALSGEKFRDKMRAESMANKAAIERMGLKLQ
jgi:tripartite-type tricarboxylate transporter receptor subunit TctC